MSPLLDMIGLKEHVLHVGGQGPATPVELRARSVEDKGRIYEEGRSRSIVDVFEQDIMVRVDLRIGAIGS